MLKTKENKIKKESILNGLADVLAHGLKTGKEAVVGIDANGKRIGINYGSRNRVSIKGLEKSIITIHNHSDNTPFSSRDLKNFIRNDNEKIMMIIGHDETIYSLEKDGKGHYYYRGNNASLTQKYGQLKGKKSPIYKEWHEKSEKKIVTPEVARKERCHQAMKKTAPMYGLIYNRENKK